MWDIVSRELAERNTGNVSMLSQSLSQLFNVGADQTAALSFRLRGPALMLVIFVAMVASLLIGFGFGRRGSPHWFISGIYALLLVVLVFVIIDLDSPRSGFFHYNLQPLVDAQRMMQGT